MKRYLFAAAAALAISASSAHAAQSRQDDIVLTEDGCFLLPAEVERGDNAHRIILSTYAAYGGELNYQRCDTVGPSVDDVKAFNYDSWNRLLKLVSDPDGLSDVGLNKETFDGYQDLTDAQKQWLDRHLAIGAELLLPVELDAAWQKPIEEAIAVLQREVANRDRTIEALLDENKELSQSNAALREEAQAEIERLRQERDEARADARAAQERAQEAELLSVALQENRAEFADQLETERQRNANLQRDLDEMRDHVERERARAQEAGRRASSFEEDRDELQRELTALKNKLEQVRAEKEVAFAERDTFSEAQYEYEKKLASVEEELSGKRAELSELREAHNDLVESFQAHIPEHEVLKSEVAELRERVDELTKKRAASRAQDTTARPRHAAENAPAMSLFVGSAHAADGETITKISFSFAHMVFVMLGLVVTLLLLMLTVASVSNWRLRRQLQKCNRELTRYRLATTTPKVREAVFGTGERRVAV